MKKITSLMLLLFAMTTWASAVSAKTVTEDEPVPALAAVSQTPAADEVVESFSSITIKFNKDIEFIQADGGTGAGTTTSGPAQYIKLKDANNGVVATAWVSAATIDGNKVTFVFEMNASISKTGTYTFAIPAGLIKATDGEEFAGETFTFQVEEPVPALAAVSQTPAADEVVESFSSITIKFNKDIEFIQADGGTGAGTTTSGPAQYIKLKDANNGVVATAWVSAATIDGNKVTFVFEMNASISKTGTYTFAIPAGLIKATDGEEFGAKTFTFQVEEPKYSIYDGQVEKYELAVNKDYDVLAYNRTLPNMNWNALYVPFEIAVEDIAEDYDVAYINDVHSYDNDGNGEIDEMEMEVIKMKKGVLKANYPYLIRAKNEAAKEIAFEFENTTLYAAAKNEITCSSVFARFDVIGNYSTLSAEDLKGCYAISTDGMWQPLAENTVLKPFRHYLRITDIEGSPVKSENVRSMSIRVAGEEGTTAIDELDEQVADSEVIYDLQGRKVNEITVSGIYIINGKKVVVK